MSGHWWRAYDEAVDDPKLQRLSDALLRAWFNLMCVASANGGALPAIDDVSFKLRMKVAKAEAAIAGLVAAGLFDEVDGKLKPHNWDGRQFQSDVSTDRVKRFRERKRNVTSAVSATPPETETETETETEKKERKEDVGLRPPPAGRYFFEAGVIRLSKKDFEAWAKAFKNINLAAELTGLAEWAGKQEKWFHAVAGALAKRDRQALLALEAAKVAPVPGQPLPDGHPKKWLEGIL